ncbi:hypothetical protein AB0N79_12920 [Streptomyces microflavus]|uniref:hypothetical protein n=1 Tax=Streptomyces microflavus TaxID=1919 RepID=UPI003420D614
MTEPIARRSLLASTATTGLTLAGVSFAHPATVPGLPGALAALTDPVFLTGPPR